MKIVVRYVGGAIGEPGKGQIFGGTAATNYAIKKAFENSDKFELQMKMRSDFENIHEVKKYLDGGNVSWCDETGLLGSLYEAGYDRPDIIGPISRSPVKRYNNGEWRAQYTPEWFYSGPVMRLNEAEEREKILLDEFKGQDFVKNITFIRHGIDLELMKAKKMDRIYILWAGSASRPAKNYQMWLDIQQQVNLLGGLPLPYKFKTMSGYSVDDYWDTLNETALVVNTSIYESFCCAVAEARSKGAGALVRENFNGKIVHLKQPGQTKYESEEYAKKIIELCNNEKKIKKLQKDSLNYVKKNCGLDSMHDDIGEVITNIFKKKINNF